jgi:hypothetical protein
MEAAEEKLARNGVAQSYLVVCVKNENVLIKGINEEYLSDVCRKVVQDGPS